MCSRGPDAIQESGEARAWIAPLDAGGAEQLGSNDSLRSHEREVFD